MDDHSLQPRLGTADMAADLTCDVAIVGGGFAGSLLALVLARRGLSPLVIDLHDPYPHQFRCEKFSLEQIDALTALGAADAFTASELSGHGLRYDRMVNALRAQWPDTVVFTKAKVTGVMPGSIPGLTLNDGRRVASRLCVLATGLSEKLRHDLGLQRKILSEAHSICVGFNLVRDDGYDFDFEGLVHHGEKPGDGAGFASLFHLGDLMRVNLFLFDSPKSPRVQRLRHDPLNELLRLMPGLRGKLAQARLTGEAEMRVTDLYTVDASALNGVALIGDARRTSCPASGTGISRIINDVRTLADNYAPERLAGMAAMFETDESIRALDDKWHRQSLNGRERAVNTSLGWRMRRVATKVRAAFQKPSLASAERKLLSMGDTVRVRPALEILASLDMDGTLENLPFMPEMVALIGSEQRVLRRADRTCVEGFGLRGLKDTVFLEAARCDGSDHDNCQRDCLMFWKEAWLTDPRAPIPPVDAAELMARQTLRNLAVRHDDTFFCQSTQLSQASHFISKTHVRELLHEVRTGEMRAADFGNILVRAAINKARAALKLPELGLIVGQKGPKSKGDLNLKSGDWVRIRDADTIRATLNPQARNLGLSFEPEMTRLIGQVRQVDTVVERMIHEETGKMVYLERTVTLKDTYCLGVCAKQCPRANPLFWREAWLERVEAPTVRLAAE
ncbi:MAG TPA: FAD-dependent monooxygenase [Asticcacaulis sp.]|nr:FAD-dependent monooxygenase [Asticcacaulis sp.]